MKQKYNYSFDRKSGYEIGYTSKEGDRVELKVGRFKSKTLDDIEFDRFHGAVLSINGEIVDQYKGSVKSRLDKGKKKSKLIALANARESSEDFTRTLASVLAKASQKFPYSELEYCSDKDLFRKDSGFKIEYKTEDRDKIKLYVGQFSEKSPNKKRHRFYGAVLLVNGEEAEKYRGKLIRDELSESRTRLMSLANSKVDIEEFVQALETIQDEFRELEFRADDEELEKPEDYNLPREQF